MSLVLSFPENGELDLPIAAGQVVTTVPFGSAKPWLALEKKGRLGVNTFVIPNTLTTWQGSESERLTSPHIHAHSAPHH